MTPKHIKIAEAQEGADALEDVLERIHGADFELQIPGHFGNGCPDENTRREECDAVSKTT
jgi:hypothetical protein